MSDFDLWEDEPDLLLKLDEPKVESKLKENELPDPISSAPPLIPKFQKKGLVRVSNKTIEIFTKGDMRKHPAINNDLGSIYNLKEYNNDGIYYYSAALGAVNAYVLRYILKLIDVEISPADVKLLGSVANKLTPPIAKISDTGKHIEIITPNIRAYQDVLKKVNAYPNKTGYRVGIGRVLDLEGLVKISATTLPKFAFDESVLKLSREPIPGFDGSLNSLKMIPIESLNVVNSNLQQWKHLKTNKKPLEDKFADFGISTLHDLLFTLPKRFIDKSNPQEITGLIEGESVTIIGKIVSVASLPNQMGVYFIVKDGKGRQLKSSFWRQQWLKTKFKPGEEVLLTGKVTRFRGKIELNGSSIEHAEEAAVLPIVPIYKQSESRGITTYLIMSAARELLSRAGKIELPIYLKKNNRLDYTQALTELHFPSSLETFKQACGDLGYYELVYMQLLMQEAKASEGEKFGLSQRSTSGLQKKAIELLPFTLTSSQVSGIAKLNELLEDYKPTQTLLNGDVGSGKGLPENEVVLTPTGFTAIKNIKVGDSVIGSDGKPTKVTGVYPQGKQDVAKLTFNDNTEIITDLNHLWTLIPMQQWNSKDGGSRSSKTISTGQLLTEEMNFVDVQYRRRSGITQQKQLMYTHFKDKRNCNRWKIPLLSNPVEYEDRVDLLIDPYLLGYWLGDGVSAAGQISVGKQDIEETKALIEKVWASPLKVYSDKRDGNFTISLNRYPNMKRENKGLLDLLREENLYKNKHIPEKYLLGSPDQRLALLQGLIDSDGSISSSGNVEFGNTNTRIIEGCVALVRSLGGTAKISVPRFKKYLNKDGVKIRTKIASYGITINLPFGLMPSRLPRKASRYGEKFNSRKPGSHAFTRSIINVEKLPIQMKTICIKVDAEDELFVTKDYIVTHNTIVAQMACLQSVDAGYQAVLLGPTEILARQLYSTFLKIKSSLIPFGVTVNIEFLEAKLKAAEKRALLKRLADGEIDVVVGTTSVLGKTVKYKNLGIVVIDEQQKFGAEQRTQLLSSRSDGRVPDLLMQSATPIPRSTAQVFYGDMEMILLDEKPPGRLPIVTEWINEDPVEFAHQVANNVWSDVQKEAANGNQTFVITPMVHDSDKVDAASVERTYASLKDTTLRGLSVAHVHGRMKKEEQQSVMADFRAKKYDVLVASTVVEVGVDIPDATRVIILSADRMGASSLHQIRGRVGRNSKQSKCYLVSVGKTANSQVRLQSLVDSENGFDIALADLDVRGEGKMFGTDQSGSSEMIFASLARHKEWIEQAKVDAKEILSSTHKNIALEDAQARYESAERLF